MKRLLFLLVRRPRLVILVGIIGIGGVAAVAARTMSLTPHGVDLTWEQLLPPSAKAGGVASARVGRSRERVICPVLEPVRRSWIGVSRTDAVEDRDHAL